MKKILVWLLAAGLAPAVCGYEFQVSPVTQLGPLEKEQHRLDVNGEADCGLLWVKTDIPQLKLSSVFGSRGQEKTQDGYAIYFTQGTAYLTLSAPGFKTLRWELNLPEKGMKDRQYAAQIQAIGQDPAEFSFSKHLLKGSFQQNQLGLHSRFSGGETATVKIDTDLPFAVLEQELLIPGSYRLKGGKTAAPYYLVVSGGTPLKQVLCRDLLKGDIPWETVLEAKGDYRLDLSWGLADNSQSVAAEVKQQLKNRMK